MKHVSFYLQILLGTCFDFTTTYVQDTRRNACRPTTEVHFIFVQFYTQMGRSVKF
jgi:hypothetical protein